MFNILVDYPDEAEELLIVKQTTADVQAQITPTLSAAEIEQLCHIVRRVPVADHVAQYAVQFTRRTRPEHPQAPASVKEYVSWGAGPRASQCIVLGAKARAALQGRYFVEPADIRAVALPVLRHRIITNFNAEAAGVKADDIVAELSNSIPIGQHRAVG
jgi:MoxR-like ATPase